MNTKALLIFSNIDWTRDAALPFVFAVLGGGFTLLATLIQQRHQANVSARESAEVVQAAIACIYDELKVLSHWYLSTLGADISSITDGGFLAKSYPVAENYFPIFNAIASRLGFVKSADARMRVVRTYTRARILIDMVRMNNSLLIKLEALSHDAYRSQHALVQQEVATQKRVCVEYAGLMKQAHEEFKSDLLPLLQTLAIICSSDAAAENFTPALNKSTP